MIRRPSRLGIVLLCWMAAVVPVLAESPAESLSITLVGVPQADRAGLVEKVHAEDRRLLARLDRRVAGSELARLNADRQVNALSPELAALLQLCEQWRDRSANAFSCRTGELVDLWQTAHAKGQLPDRTGLRQSARALADLDWSPASAGQKASLPPSLQLEPGNLLHGYRLDRLLSFARALAPQATGIALETPDRGIYWGVDEESKAWQREWQAGPKAVSEAVHLSGRAWARVEPGRAFMTIEHGRFSHWLHPDDGWALNTAPSTWVVAPSAAQAEVLAAALVVMPIRQGLALVNELADTEAWVMTEAGHRFTSEHWYGLLTQDTGEWSGTVRVDYDIPTLSVAEYRRPYAALWITGGDRQWIRHLRVHGDNPRWLRELSLWWRRHGRRDEAAIDGLARATPVPGRHHLIWDGRDDRGQRMPAGQYTLHFEISREHGGRETVSVDFSLDGQAFEHRISGETELGIVSVRLTKE